MGRFHFRAGWYFSRQEDGSVLMEQCASDRADAPVIASLVIDPDSWASIVASVSAQGETNGRWFKARDFHNDQG